MLTSADFFFTKSTTRLLKESDQSGRILRVAAGATNLVAYWTSLYHVGEMFTLVPLSKLSIVCETGIMYVFFTEISNDQSAKLFFFISL